MSLYSTILQASSPCHLTRIYFFPISENEQEMLINGFVLADGTHAAYFCHGTPLKLSSASWFSGLVIAIRSDHSVVCSTCCVSFPLWRRADTIRMNGSCATSSPLSSMDYSTPVKLQLAFDPQATWRQYCA